MDFGFSFRYKLVDVAFLMHKLLQRVKVMKVAGELAREGNGGEGVQGGEEERVKLRLIRENGSLLRKKNASRPI